MEINKEVYVYRFNGDIIINSTKGLMDYPGWVLLGSIQIDTFIPDVDTNQLAIDELRKQVVDIDTESQAKIEALMSEIGTLKELGAQ